jgi:hypothetical protein
MRYKKELGMGEIKSGNFVVQVTAHMGEKEKHL